MQLVKAVQDSRFYLLEERYSYEVTDNPTLILRVTMNRRSHEVMEYAPDHLKQSEEVAAFLKVWNQVLRYVPSPNPGQGVE